MPSSCSIRYTSLLTGNQTINYTQIKHDHVSQFDVCDLLSAKQQLHNPFGYFSQLMYVTTIILTVDGLMGNIILKLPLKAPCVYGCFSLYLSCIKYCILRSLMSSGFLSLAYSTALSSGKPEKVTSIKTVASTQHSTHMTKFNPDYILYYCSLEVCV